MPLADWGLKATWDANYDVGSEPGAYVPVTRPEIRLHYTRATFWLEAQSRAARFVQIMSLTTNDTVVILGGAFGWTAEALVVNHGIQAISVDTSAWVQSVKDQPETDDLDAAISAVGLDPATGTGAAIKGDLIIEGGGSGNRARVPVANEQINNPGSRNRVKGLFASGRVTVVITEDLLSSLTDAEIGTLAGRAAALDTGVRVGHFLTTLGTIAPSQPPPVLNGKTLVEWRTLIDSLGFPVHVLIEAGTYRVA